ncbi:hypothetical protein P7C71_g2079, partial [Lecanoromycetidae sp. Uapishka_2]
MQIFQQPWQAKAEAKMADVRSKIPGEWTLEQADLELAKKQRKLTGGFFERFLSDADLDIIHNNSVQLVEKIKCQRYTSVEVTQAYCKAAAVAQQINNCLHEIMFDSALQTAQELDRFFEDHGTVKGPLHGLPISLKDQFHVKGYDTTMGYVGWIDTFEGYKDPAKVHKVNSQIVKELLSLGAVLYCKVVDWEPPAHSTAKRIHVSFLKADGAHDIHQQLDLSGEPLVPPLRDSFQLSDPMPLLKYQDLTIEGKAYSAAYYDYWNSTANDDDAVIMPVAPHAAVIPGKFYHTSYTECINLLDYSVAVIPVTNADKSIDLFDCNYQPLNDDDRKNWEAYDPDTYDGAPVGLQIVARKHEEEKVWAIAKIVDAALHSNGSRDQT